MAYFLGSIAAFLVQKKLIENFVMVFSCCRNAQLKTILIIFSATDCSFHVRGKKETAAKQNST